MFFGTGKRCEYLIEENKTFLQEQEIVAFADNDQSKWGKLFWGKDIISPRKIKDYQFDFIYIASTYYQEIRTQLIYELGIEEEIIKGENYLAILFGRKEKKEHYDRMRLRSNNRLDLEHNRIVVYTAIYGEYDDLKDPEFVDDRFAYVCFTDRLDIRSNVWKVIYKEKNEEYDTRRRAKIYKILPHKFFPEYDLSIWVDGSVVIRGDLREYIQEHLKRTNLLFMVHPWRNCIYAEAEYSMAERSFEGLNEMKEQIVFYEAQGMPKNNGLISGGFIVRKHNETDVVSAMEQWWNEICNFSTQDQISFGYVAWKNKLQYDVAAEWIYDNKYIYLKAHLIDENKGEQN